MKILNKMLGRSSARGSKKIAYMLILMGGLSIAEGATSIIGDLTNPSNVFVEPTNGAVIYVAGTDIKVRPASGAAAITAAIGSITAINSLTMNRSNGDLYVAGDNGTNHFIYKIDYSSGAYSTATLIATSASSATAAYKSLAAYDNTRLAYDDVHNDLYAQINGSLFCLDLSNTLGNDAVIPEALVSSGLDVAAPIALNIPCTKLYVANTASLAEYVVGTWGSSSATGTYTGITAPVSASVDATGNVYVADTAAGKYNAFTGGTGTGASSSIADISSIFADVTGTLFYSDDAAIFRDGAITIAVAEDVTLSHQTLTGPFHVTVNKTDIGTLSIGSDSSSLFYGKLTLSAGTTQYGHVNSLGDTSNITLSGGTLKAGVEGTLAAPINAITADSKFNTNSVGATIEVAGNGNTLIVEGGGGLTFNSYTGDGTDTDVVEVLGATATTLNLNVPANSIHALKANTNSVFKAAVDLTLQPVINIHDSTTIDTNGHALAAPVVAVVTSKTITVRGGGELTLSAFTNDATTVTVVDGANPTTLNLTVPVNAITTLNAGQNSVFKASSANQILTPAITIAAQPTTINTNKTSLTAPIALTATSGLTVNGGGALTIGGTFTPGSNNLPVTLSEAGTTFSLPTLGLANITEITMNNGTILKGAADATVVSLVAAGDASSVFVDPQGHELTTQALTTAANNVIYAVSQVSNSVLNLGTPTYGATNTLYIGKNVTVSGTFPDSVVLSGTLSANADATLTNFRFR